MNTHTLITLLRLAGLLHLGLLAAGLLMPRVVNLRAHLADLPPFIRRLFWVYYIFIGFCLISFGSLTVILAPSLASGITLARGLCLFLATFWTIRFCAAMFIFDLRPYLTNKWRLVGYHLTNVVFTSLPIIYLLAAWKGGAP